MRAIASMLGLLLGIGTAYGAETVTTTLERVDFSDVDWFAQRARAAYSSPEIIEQTFPDVVRVAAVPGTEVQYFLETIPERKLQVVSVRGTDNLHNIAQDVDFLLTRNTKLGIYVHHGFDLDTRKVYQDILPHLDRDMEIRLTGHSLGAAISTLLMMYLHDDGYNVGPSVNFGQPKLTNKEGVDRFQFLSLTRVVDANDPVPLVPPVTLVDLEHGVFEHLGSEVILLSGEYYAYLPKHDATRLSVGDFWENIGEESATDHHISQYANNIHSKLGTSAQIPYQQREQYIQQ